MTNATTTTCDGTQFLVALQAAARWLEQHVGDVNALNVFPVPDGDTGTNMNLTLGAALKDVKPQASVGAICAIVQKQALRGARGNSGVILSQILRGFSEGIGNAVQLDAQLLALAFTRGAERAYKAVMKPTEGTMLTVIRVVGEHAQAAADDGASLEVVLQAAVDGARAAVADTPNLLKQLRDAGVVDAGGQGIAVILDGVLRCVQGQGVERPDAPVVTAAVAFQDIHSDDDFGYCTTFLLEGAEIPFEQVRAQIASMGSSVVVVGDDTTVKAHVHTLRPGDVLNYVIDFGALTHVEIANMDAQRAQLHATGAVAAVAGREPKEASMGSHVAEQARAAAVEQAPIGVVAIAPGPGWAEIFHSAQVGEVVTGGQTMNPSTAELAEAIERLPQQQVIVLPNNSNILLAAKQAQEIVDKQVTIIPTRTIPQGVAAILSLNYEFDLERNVKMMQRAIEKVRTIEITTAVRDATVDGTEVRTGQTIGLLDDKLIAAGDTCDRVVDKMLVAVGMDDYEVVTIYLGEGVGDEQGMVLAERIRASYPHLEQVEIQSGGQPFYDFILAIE
ncbi:MAG: DAK2 domain-containing protein [Herpetosiphonaceae bacterium]|nr:DAK2 domain-containing protein [Herpetosiphonaceae bacterium]